MFENDHNIEFDFSKKNNKYCFWRSILVRFTSVVFLILLTSYHSPDHSSKNFVAPYQTIDLQLELQSRVYNLVNDDDKNINDIDWLINVKVEQFFDQVEFLPFWTIDYDSNERYAVLNDLLDSAMYFGFPYDYFGIQTLDSLRSSFISSKSLQSRVDLEVATTFSAFKFMLFLNKGIVGENLSNECAQLIESFPQLLKNSSSAQNLRVTILSLQPDLIQYRRIVNSLPHFVDLHLSVRYTTPKFIDDKLLAKALYYAGVRETAEIDTNDNNRLAIAMLQEQFRLPKDSVLNQSTHQVLASLLDYRYYQASLNLNRLRSVQNTDNDFLFVNIPEFRLQVFESKQEKQAFNVIVGTKETPTPVFSSSIEKVVTNPHWTVPKSIADKMIPKIRKDSTYLKRNGYMVINSREEEVDVSEIDWNTEDPLGWKYCLRQKNSPNNALGLVKFVFPNEHSVYIHDTPSRNLFNEKTRTFSHGCIRLENPDKLAQYLADKFYTQNSYNIKDLISTRNSSEINLDQKVKIHIQYITCSGKENADMEFYGDIYNLDRQDITGLFPVKLEI